MVKKRDIDNSLIMVAVVIVLVLIFMFNNGGNKIPDEGGSKMTIVILETSKGNIEIELNNEYRIK